MRKTNIGQHWLAVLDYRGGQTSLYLATSGDELQFCVTEQAGSAAKDQVVGGATVHTAQEVDVHVTPDGITTDHIILDKKKRLHPPPHPRLPSKQEVLYEKRKTPLSLIAHRISNCLAYCFLTTLCLSIVHSCLLK